jgi:hypothetical protein
MRANFVSKVLLLSEMFQIKITSSEEKKQNCSDKKMYVGMKKVRRRRTNFLEIFSTQRLPSYNLQLVGTYLQNY